MLSETQKHKAELRDLIDAYATLGDRKEILEQMKLFTPDATYQVFMGETEIGKTVGTDNIAKQFTGHAAEVKTYFTFNGQHTINIDGDSATGVSFSQLKMVREKDGKDSITDYSVRYEDTYVFQNGKWLIKIRKGYFMIIETRVLN